MTKDHYSYRVYADPQVARTFDADRFGGSIGELIKRTQQELVFSILRPEAGWKVVDIGAGTGRFTIPFLQAGASVTACDASREMLQVLQDKVNDPALQILVADAHALQLPDRAFDCALSFRMLLHVIDWKKALSEICRVSNDWVAFDFPPRHGFLLFAPLRHGLSRLWDRNHQPYRTFRFKEIEVELNRNGFEVVHTDSGFFLPLAIHRALRSVFFTRSSEAFFARTGLTRLAGAPFTVFARRKK